jgi:hypothetical protein
VAGKVQLRYATGALRCTPCVHGDECVERKGFNILNVQATCNAK